MAGKAAAVAEAPKVEAAPALVAERQPLNTAEKLAGPAQLESVRAVLQSPGDPLDPETRGWAETRFGHSFSHVRLHAGSDAAESAASVEALAYTVGNHVVLGAGRFDSRSREGRDLIAHELAHVVQQRHARPAGASLAVGPPCDAFEQEAEQAVSARPPGLLLAEQRLQRVSWWQKIIRFFGAEGTFEDDELQAYLKFLDSNGKIEDNFDSDNKAREVVRRWQAGRPGYQLSVKRKVLLLKEMISGPTLDGDEKGMIAILSGSPDSDLAQIFKQLTPATMRKEIGGDNLINYDYVIAQYTARSTDPFSKTSPPTATQHLVTESVLNPGSTLVEAPPPPKKPEPPPPKKEETPSADKKEEEATPPAPKKDEAPPPKKEPPPPPVFKDASAMTGLPPAPGVPGDFEKEMVAVLAKYAKGRGAAFRAKKKAGKGFPVAKAQPIAKAAQSATEEYFGPYIQVASHAPADKYHPGAFSLVSELHDQSEVPINDDGSNGHPGRVAWVRYWMAQDNSGGKAVLSKYKCVTSRSPDKEEFFRVAALFATDAANRGDIDDTIHGWPAEATAGVNLQPYEDVSTRAKERHVRWDTYTTLLHEMMHIVQHPNYVRTYRLIPGSGQEILKEGMADVMRRDLWDGPGRLKARLATDSYDAVREQIEGSSYDYDESVVFYHPDYPLYTEARKIVDGDGKYPGVGMPNARAAFFLGHTDLLGLGEGTRAAGSLAGIANYQATDAENAQIVEAQAGDTFETIRDRTGAAPGGILDAATGKPIKAGDAIAAGAKLRVPGIRWVHAIEEDTLGSIAAQNRVDPAKLAVANGLAAGTNRDHKFPAGTRVLIPIHAGGP